MPQNKPMDFSRGLSRDKPEDLIKRYSFLMNYPEAGFEVSIKPTHPFVPSLAREGKPSEARRGELSRSKASRNLPIEIK
jgi:hypothetical protein